MPSEALTLATDRIATRATKRCTNCGKPKAIDEFARNRSRHDGLSSQCRRCLRIAEYERYHERDGKEAKVAYHARPEVKARRREYDRGRQGLRNASKAVHRSTPRGKVVECRYKAQSKLRQAVTDERRAALETLIAAYDRELARMEAVPELPDEPARVRVRKYGESPGKGIYLTPAGTFEVKISVGTGKSVRGGTFATVDEARDAANALAFRLRGIKNYAVLREERERL